MPDRPNKPGADRDDAGDPKPIDEQQAVKNQGSAEPEDYPAPAGGKLPE